MNTFQKMIKKIDNFKQQRPFKNVKEHEYFCGVLGGFAYAFGLNVFWTRVVFMILAGSIPVLGAIYCILGFCAETWETDPKDYDQVTG